MPKKRKRRTRTQPGDPDRAVSYVRVSTLKQAQAFGPDAQRDVMKSWAVACSATIVEEFVDDGISGAREHADRPGLHAAIASLRVHRAGVLLVAKRDRLARDMEVVVAVEREVRRMGAKIVAADGAGNGEGLNEQLMRRMVDAIAEHERGLIRQRTKAALAVRRRQGLRTGSVPLGFRLADDGSHLVAYPHERAAQRRAVQLRAEGLTYREIARELDDERFATRSGKGWHPQTVHRLVRRVPEGNSEQDAREVFAALSAVDQAVSASMVANATMLTQERVERALSQLLDAGTVTEENSLYRAL